MALHVTGFLICTMLPDGRTDVFYWQDGMSSARLVCQDPVFVVANRVFKMFNARGDFERRFRSSDFGPQPTCQQGAHHLGWAFCGTIERRTCFRR